MGLFDKIKEPVFLKEDSTAEVQLKAMEQLLPSVSDAKHSCLERDIRALKAGIAGEAQILFELRNSHIPMFVLHDLYLSDGNLTAQIDYLIVTRKCCFVLECKNLYGNIEINNAGDFVRTVHYNGHTYKEGIYSPLTQNERHMALIMSIRGDSRGNIFSKAMFTRHFGENYKSVVVLANPQTVLNARYAKAEVKNQVIRADQLIAFIRQTNAYSPAETLSEAEMEKLAHWFLAQNKPNETDYLKKYAAIEKNAATAKPSPVKASPVEAVVNTAPKPNPAPQSNATVVCPKCGAPMVKRKATRGANSGKEFYGCSSYPKCHGIVNLTEIQKASASTD